MRVPGANGVRPRGSGGVRGAAGPGCAVCGVVKPALFGAFPVRKKASTAGHLGPPGRLCMIFFGFSSREMGVIIFSRDFVVFASHGGCFVLFTFCLVLFVFWFAFGFLFGLFAPVCLTWVSAFVFVLSFAGVGARFSGVSSSFSRFLAL